MMSSNQLAVRLRYGAMHAAELECSEEGSYTWLCLISNFGAIRAIYGGLAHWPLIGFMLYSPYLVFSAYGN